MVLTHADGWQTQYCHMARGSIAVAKGQRVKAGDPLGLIGLSGDTQFPHLHLSVRQGARKVDPFAPDAAPGTCSPAAGPTLWTADAAKALAYHETEILNLGFADGPVAMEAIDAESLARPTSGSAALVGYGRVIGLGAGDRMQVAIADPTGALLAENAAVVSTNKAQYMLFTGKKRPAAGWAKGRYTITVTVTRGDRPVVRRTDALNL